MARGNRMRPFTIYVHEELYEKYRKLDRRTRKMIRMHMEARFASLVHDPPKSSIDFPP